MKAAVNKSFGGPEVVKIEEVEIPKLLKHQILVQVHSSTVSSADCRLRSKNVPRGFGFIMSLLFGFNRPKYSSLGTEIAGTVNAVGSDVLGFRSGDRIVANLGMKLGGHAEYCVINQDAAITKIPQSVGFNDAAALVFGGTTALAFLRDKLKIKSGERLLVVGAGGAVGSAAVQLGLFFGAKVTSVCSKEKIKFVQKLGLSEIIDYSTSDWLSDQNTYDVILDTVGQLHFSNVKHKLSPRGRLGLVVADLPRTLHSLWISMTHEQKVYAGPFNENSEDLRFLVELLEQKKFVPLIGSTFPIEKIVEAHKIAESGHKLGSVVLEIKTI